MGYAARTEGHRYVEWRNNATGEILHRELYDHRKDPAEMKNVAGAEKNRDVVEALSNLLRDGWRAVLPPAP